MKIPDPVIIGSPARDEPLVLGLWTGHGLDPDLLIGTRVNVAGTILCVNVSYVPANPKRQTLVTILEPKSEITDGFWRIQGMEQVQHKPKPQKQEEFPF